MSLKFRNISSSLLSVLMNVDEPHSEWEILTQFVDAFTRISTAPWRNTKFLSPSQCFWHRNGTIGRSYMMSFDTYAIVPSDEDFHAHWSEVKRQQSFCNTNFLWPCSAVVSSFSTFWVFFDKLSLPLSFWSSSCTLHFLNLLFWTIHLQQSGQVHCILGLLWLTVRSSPPLYRKKYSPCPQQSVKFGSEVETSCPLGHFRVRSVYFKVG